MTKLNEMMEMRWVMLVHIQLVNRDNSHEWRVLRTEGSGTAPFTYASKGGAEYVLESKFPAAWAAQAMGGEVRLKAVTVAEWKQMGGA